MVFDESLHVEVNNDYCAKWMKSDPEASDNLRGPVSNDVSFCTYILMAFTCKVSLPLELQHMIGLCSENLWCIPSLRAKFETHCPFLCLKQGPNTFTIAITLLVYGLDRKCNTYGMQEHIRRYRGRPDVKCIHCAMITHLEGVG